jgi:hypothetical protein
LLISSKPWFGTGVFGQYVAVPCAWEGWATAIGISLPAAVYAFLGGCPGALLAIGLFAFLFGLSYAMAVESRDDAPKQDRLGWAPQGGEPIPELEA